MIKNFVLANASRYVDVFKDRDIVFFLILLSILFKFSLISIGLPYIELDEGHVLLRVLHMLNNDTWDAGWYRYPTFLANAIYVVCRLFEWLGFPITEVSNGLYEYNNVGPATLILVGRIIVLSTSIAIPVLIFKTARQLKLSLMASAFAGIFVALSPTFVSRSYFIITDTVAAFFVVCTFYAISKIITKSHWSWVLWAGIFSGLAFTSKYPSGGVALAVGLAVLIAYRTSWKSFLGYGFLSAFGFFAAVLTTMPQWLFNRPEVLLDIQEQAVVYAKRSTVLTYFESAIRDIELGVPLILILCAGCLLGCLKKLPRTYLIVASPYLAIALYMSSLYDYQPFRNLLPVIAALSIASAFFLDGIRELELPPFVKRFRSTWVTGLAMIILAFVLAGHTIEFRNKALNNLNSRVETVKWISNEFTSEYNVLASRELAFSREHIGRNATSLNVCREADLALCLEDGPQFDLLLLSNAGFERLSELEKLNQFEIVQRFGNKKVPSHKNYWVHPRVEVVILKALPAVTN